MHARRIQVPVDDVRGMREMNRAGKDPEESNPFHNVLDSDPNPVPFAPK